MTLEQLFDAAIKHQEAGRLGDAQQFFRQILAVDPRQPNVLQRLARVTHELGDHAGAEAHLRNALEISPDSPDYWIDLALLLLAQGRTGEAITASEKALALRPDDASILCNLGYMFHAAGRPHDGIKACQRALTLRPDYAYAFNNLGINLAELDLFEQSVVVYRKALEILPRFPKALNNLAVSLNAMNRCEEAVAACRAAIELAPAYADAHNNAGSFLQNLARHDEAMAEYRRAMELIPDFATAQSNYLFAHCYHPAAGAAQLRDESRRWAQSLESTFKVTTVSQSIDRSPDRRLRIGYVSADLRFHSVAFFLLPLLEGHDRAQFHITCYPCNNRADEITGRVRAACDQWHPITALPDQEACELIRRDGIDILVDLGGHTANNRLPIFARKPAPLQVSWLGYPATTGLDAMDYRITDAVTDPPSDDPGIHSEKLLRLPQTAWCFTPLSGSPPIEPPPHLAKRHITFGSLNNFAKLNDETLQLWARLLRSVAGSRLVLKVPIGPETADRLYRLFAAHAVTPDRLDFLARLPNIRGHLQRYDGIDIALDTFPYNGTTTTCEALWMGVPVISRAGDSHASRVGKSLLTTLGLADLIAHSADDFLAIAEKLAGDSLQLQTLRTTLRERMRSSALMNGSAFARDMENAYRQMWREWCASQSSGT